MEDGPFVDSGGLQFVFWHHLGTKGQHLKEERRREKLEKLVSWKMHGMTLNSTSRG